MSFCSIQNIFPSSDTIKTSIKSNAYFLLAVKYGNFAWYEYSCNEGILFLVAFFTCHVVLNEAKKSFVKLVKIHHCLVTRLPTIQYIEEMESHVLLSFCFDWISLLLKSYTLDSEGEEESFNENSMKWEMHNLEKDTTASKMQSSKWFYK